ncbi:hypothetical protein BRC64_10530 [Halobacteriales archaeon QH_10_67_22]|nr:MAG: hypothetical protein BRC64_10530 [Halobacteriales archaeon QH_10_67_22]
MRQRRCRRPDRWRFASACEGSERFRSRQLSGANCRKPLVSPRCVPGMRRRRWLQLTAGTVGGLACLDTVTATGSDAGNSRSTDEHPIQEAKLAAGDGDSSDAFGQGVALDGERALVGAADDEDPNGAEAGSAYVFERTDAGWTQAAKLVPEDGDDGDRFGYQVALDGTTAVVTAYRDEDPSGERGGSAYIFERTDGEWVQEAKLSAGGADNGNRFGFTLSLDGDRALFGAPVDEDANGDDSVAAYLFERTGGEWSRVDKLVPDSERDRRESFNITVERRQVRQFGGAGRRACPRRDLPGRGSIRVGVPVRVRG